MSAQVDELPTGIIEAGDARVMVADMSGLSLAPASVDVVLFHGGCPDGFTAAYYAWTVLGDAATYVGIGHGTPEEKEEAAGDLAGKNVVVLDFSFDAATTARQLAAAAGYAVLDHHKTAEANLASLPAPNKIFEMGMSGATLAHNFFFPPPAAGAADSSADGVPLLARYVEDKDIWRWAHHSSKEFAAAFLLAVEVPRPGPVGAADFAKLHALATGGGAALQRLLAQGSVLLRYQESLVKQHAKRAAKTGTRRLRAFPALRCAVVNATVLASEIGNRCASGEVEGAQFALIYSTVPHSGSVSLSLRSCFGTQEGQADVSKIAQHFGGGGHACASGCRIATDDINSIFVAPGETDEDEGEDEGGQAAQAGEGGGSAAKKQRTA